MFLTPNEVEDLTGYQRHADQRRWLTDHGWQFVVAATGRPILARSYVETKLGGTQRQKTQAWMPNLSAIK